MQEEDRIERNNIFLNIDLNKLVDGQLKCNYNLPSGYHLKTGDKLKNGDQLRDFAEKIRDALK